MKTKEIWKNIPGTYGKYQVSNMGNVRSLLSSNKSGHAKFHVLKPAITSSGYYAVNLYVRGTLKSRMIHRLVAKTFLGSDYKFNSKKYVVDHKNENKLDNRLENLHYILNIENKRKAAMFKRIKKYSTEEYARRWMDFIWNS